MKRLYFPGIIARSSLGTLTIIAMICALLLSSCHPKSYDFEPRVCFQPQEYHVGNLPHAFLPLSPEELQTDWGRELLIGNKFAREFDFYRALTSYKRALILIPPSAVERSYEINYAIIQSYYLAGKYQDAINSFEESPLVHVPPSFPPFNDLLLIIYDCYTRIGECEKAESIDTLLKLYSPEVEEKINLSHALEKGDLRCASLLPAPGDLHDKTVQFAQSYCRCAKSVKKAQWLNAILPGAGYAYVGQKQSALTSFVINALFIAGAYQFFHRGYWAAGGIMTSLECGWYFGGINGAGLEAKQWNERLYQANAHHFMYENRLFPVFMLEKTF